jgi:archaemetzincin
VRAWATIALLASACGAETVSHARAPAPAVTTRAAVAIDGAVGTTERLEGDVRWAFADGPWVEPLPPPRPGDWLAEHDEPGQTVEQFLAERPNRPTRPRDKIYLLPIGSPAEDGPPSIADLAELAHRYYGLEAVVLPVVDVRDLEVTARARGGIPAGGRGARRQLLAPDVLRELRGRVPYDAYCLIAVTVEDLYPDDDWNYVFGYASLTGRVGVFSLARYNPAFFGHEPGPGSAELIVRRGYKVVVHEIGHMFGMQHCTAARCIMNGSNHLDELDARPLRLCPVCLRKLHLLVGFEPRRRYEELRELFAAHALADEAAWIDDRLRAAP